MKLDFAKNTKRNIIASGINKILGLFLPFVNRTLFLWLLGSEYLGLNGLFVSILGVLSLADLGFGTAVVCSMYKPIADDDKKLVCAFLKFYRTVYRVVGTVIFCGGLVLLPFLRHLVHGDVPPDIDLHVLYVIHLVNTAASYFLFAYRGSILSAYHRGDVITNIHTVLSLAQYAIVFLILFLTRNYYHYIIATVAFTVIRNILIYKESRRLFPEIEPSGVLPDDKRRHVISEVKSIFMHKIGAVITTQSDNIVISALLGLVSVAAYGNYYYVIKSVSGLTWSVYTSTQSGFGNKIHTETKEENFKLFMNANRLVLIIVLWCAAVMAAIIQPFIILWTRGDPKLVCHGLTGALMVLYFYVTQARQTLLTFKAAADIWQEDRWKPLVAGIANLTMNILLVIFLPMDYKLDGVILSTILSLLFIQIPWETHVVFSVFFNRQQAKAYWRSQFGFALLTLAICTGVAWATQAAPLESITEVLSNGLASLMPSKAETVISGMADLILKGIFASLLTSLLILAFFHKDIQAIIQKLRNRKKKSD